MIPFKSFLGFKKVDKEAWLAQKVTELETEFEADLKGLCLACDEMTKEKTEEFDALKKKYALGLEALERTQRKLDRAQEDLEDLLNRVNDKKIDLLKANKELSAQIRVTEAKASPANVWVNAFESGFSKAWGMMKPVMYEGFDKVKQEISDNAKMETLNGLQSVLRGKDGFDSEKD